MIVIVFCPFLNSQLLLLLQLRTFFFGNNYNYNYGNYYRNSTITITITIIKKMNTIIRDEDVFGYFLNSKNNLKN